MKLILILIAALAKALSIHLIYIGDLIAYLALITALSLSLNFSRPVPFKGKFVDVFVVAILGYFGSMIVVSWGFSFLQAIAYGASFWHFIIGGLCIIIYCLISALFLSVLINTMAIMTLPNIDLMTSLKNAVWQLRHEPMQTIVFLTPLGILLFAPYQWQIQLNNLFGHNYMSAIAYIVIYVSLFFLGYKLAEIRLLQQIPSSPPESKIIHHPQSSSSFMFNFTRALAIASLIFSPFISLVIYFSGVSYGINTTFYHISLLSWLLWLVMSVYLILIRKKQSTHIAIIVLIPLIVSIVSFLAMS